MEDKYSMSVLIIQQGRKRRRKFSLARLETNVRRREGIFFCNTSTNTYPPLTFCYYGDGGI